MAKKTQLDYSDPQELLVGRQVVVAFKGGTNLGGEVRYLDVDTLVLVTEPKSALDIETQVVHTVINMERVDFIQFKTARE